MHRRLPSHLRVRVLWSNSGEDDDDNDDTAIPILLRFLECDSQFSSTHAWKLQIPYWWTNPVDPCSLVLNWPLSETFANISRAITCMLSSPKEEIRLMIWSPLLTVCRKISGHWCRKGNWGRASRFPELRAQSESPRRQRRLRYQERGLHGQQTPEKDHSVENWSYRHMKKLPKTQSWQGTLKRIRRNNA